MTQRGFRPLLFAAALAMVAAASAQAGDWRTQESAFGVIVTNGKITFPAPDGEAGENMAEILNDVDDKAARKQARQDKKDARKADKAAKKAGQGFQAEKTGPCADPLSGVNC